MIDVLPKALREVQSAPRQTSCGRRSLLLQTPDHYRAGLALRSQAEACKTTAGPNLSFSNPRHWTLRVGGLIVQQRKQEVVVQCQQTGHKLQYRSQMRPALAQRSNHTVPVEKSPVWPLKCPSTTGVCRDFAGRSIRARSAHLGPMTAVARAS